MAAQAPGNTSSNHGSTEDPVTASKLSQAITTVTLEVKVIASAREQLGEGLYLLQLVGR